MKGNAELFVVEWKGSEEETNMIIFGEVFHRVKTSERRRDRTAGEKRNLNLNLEVTCH